MDHPVAHCSPDETVCSADKYGVILSVECFAIDYYTRYDFIELYQ